MTKNEKRNTIYWFLDLLTKMTGIKHDYTCENDMWELKINSETASTTMNTKEFLHFVNGLWIYQDTIKK